MKLAFALQDDGWSLRSAIVWHTANRMPEPVTDRASSRYEYVFPFVQSESYSFDLDAIRQVYTGGRAPRRCDRSGHANKPISATGVWRADRTNYSDA
jgi:hypothetical protein